MLPSTLLNFMITGFVVFPTAYSQTHALKVVTMKSISYDPKILNIKVGDAVEWENKSLTEHSATASSASGFDTGMIAPGKKSKRVEFSKTGTYKYNCTMHGKTMSGEIVVTP